MNELQGLSEELRICINALEHHYKSFIVHNNYARDGRVSPDASSRLNPRGSRRRPTPRRSRARGADEADPEGTRPGDEFPREVRVRGQARRICPDRFAVRLPPERALAQLMSPEQR